MERTYFLVELPVHAAFSEADDEAHDEAHHGLNLNGTERRVLQALGSAAKNRPQIAKELGYPSRSGNLLRAITRLRTLGLVELTIPDKPKSPNQMLKLTDEGRAATRTFARARRRT